eukprot:gene7820-9628_t
MTDDNGFKYERFFSSPSTDHFYKNTTVNPLSTDVLSELLVNNFHSYLIRDDGPVFPLIPPSNSSIPYSYIETSLSSIFGMDTGNAGINPQEQVASQRITNHIYLYKDTVNNKIVFVLQQTGYSFPGSPLAVEKPNLAIGYFQVYFGLNNVPTYNGQQFTDDHFNLLMTSPQTVDQEHQVTNTASTKTSFSVNFEITPDGGGGGASYSKTWSTSYTDVEDISDWGVVEMTNPAPQTSGWVYHQQFPYDPYLLGLENFPVWWQQAYSGGNINYPPALSTSTLQSSVVTVWKADASIIDPNTDMLVIDINYNIQFGAILIALPGYVDSHHKEFIQEYSGLLGIQSLNLNYFPNN